MEYVSPQYHLDGFNCPYCNAYAHQSWYDTVKAYKSNIFHGLPNLEVSVCQKCNNYTLWKKEKLIYPFESKAPLPIDGMPNKVKKYYIEARNIVNLSYRGALVLLRMALQELMLELGHESKYLHKNINKIINDEEIEEQVKDAIDIIRNYGNDSAHPDIEIRGNENTALFLFNLLNYIVEDRIIRPSKIDELKELRENI